ncbi:helix-turn-helix domain-containing protein [Desulforamulus aquiferis]|uniref:Helix-turn-helix transcriptional regulator n=1 Tax=Desulforamulus aquiferis TaxID=1397668 RepID=A0AAW7ZHN2_9FIRM|nr:helix-turn-helix transcriptional regulator [Desulforamulus aquiferis]MDO7788814.1 helix-turn-helix transcriptional regulator [Desulforamulus aquiferis]
MDNKIRELRTSRNISGTKLAKELGITATYFYEIERGKKRLSAEMAAKLAVIFNVTIDYLLGQDELPIDNEQGDAALPTWATSKDKRDFKRMLEEDAPVMFDGVPLSRSDKEKIKRVMEAMFWDAKEKNKETYGRKKK